MANPESFYSTWACSQYLTEPFNMPEVSLANCSIRQIIHASIAGNKIRIKFSNRCGNGKLELQEVHIAKSAAQGSGKIIPETDTAVTFNGNSNVTIAGEDEVYSDVIDFTFDALDELSITIFYGQVPQQVTGHPGSRTMTFFNDGNHTADTDFPHEYKTAHWYTIASVDVLAAERKNVVVCFGDSITDGRGSTDDLQNRWTDNLAEALQNNEKTRNTAVINQGIGGTCVTTTGVERFKRDVLNQPGLSHIIMLYGINDIIYMHVTAETLINCYKKLIQIAHENNVKVYGGTLLPFGSNNDYTEELNQVRLEVNHWIKSTAACDGGFDAVFDFASSIKDSHDENKLALENDCSDGLHPNPQGYKVIAETIKVIMSNHF